MPHACHSFWKCYKTLTLGSLLTRCTIPCAYHAKTTSERPNPSVFDMCFAPQRHTLFRHVNFQKWSKHGVLCTFWLGHVLRATAACTFSTSQLPKVLRDVSFYFAPQRRALFRHLNFQKCSERWVHLAFSLANVLCATTACNFSSLIWPDGSASAALASLLFDPPEPQIIGKTQCFATFLPFRTPPSSIFWDFLFLVGSLTSKLPSAIVHISNNDCDTDNDNIFHDYTDVNDNDNDDNDHTKNQQFLEGEADHHLWIWAMISQSLSVFTCFLVLIKGHLGGLSGVFGVCSADSKEDRLAKRVTIQVFVLAVSIAAFSVIHFITTPVAINRGACQWTTKLVILLGFGHGSHRIS